MTRPSLIHRALVRFKHQDHANPYFASLEQAKQKRRLALGLIAGVATGGLVWGLGLTFLEARRLTAVEISGVQYLDSELLEARVAEVLEDRNFLGIKYWYTWQVPLEQIVHGLREQPLEVQGAERVGTILKINIEEQVIKGAQAQADGWHILGAQAETLAVVEAAPAGIPVFTGPISPAVLTLVADYNNILRRNNEEPITTVNCNEESQGAWCSVNLKNKLISFNVNTPATVLMKTLEPLWARSETNIDVRFSGRIYLR
jgi:hypothetical protein